MTIYKSNLIDLLGLVSPYFAIIVDAYIGLLCRCLHLPTFSELQSASEELSQLLRVGDTGTVRTV